MEQALSVLKQYNVEVDFPGISQDQYEGPEKNIFIDTKRIILNSNVEKIINTSLSNIHRTNETFTGNVPAPKTSSNHKSSINKTKTRRKFDADTQNILDKIETIKKKHNEMAKQRNLLKKYFKIWKENTNAVKERKNLKLHEFLKKIETRKKIHPKQQRITKVSKKVSNQINKPTKETDVYENRYKAQQNIILMQKTKLLEKEQEIQNLKHGKLCEELDKSIAESRQQLKEVMKQCSIKTKCKLGTVAETSDDEMDVKININQAPKIMQQMEERARERMEKRKVIQERKRLIDEERQRLAQELIEKKQQQDEEEKQRNLEAIKERRRKELELEKQKQINKQIYLSNCEKADKFYNRKLKRFTFRRIKMLMEIKESNLYKCELFYEVMIQKNCFNKWLNVTRQSNEVKLFKAHNLYRTKILRKCFGAIILNAKRAKYDYQTAEDFYDLQLQCRVFKYYYIYVCKERMRRYKLYLKAVSHYNYHILVQYFYQWKKLPAVILLEKVKEEKKNRWRMKVKEILPNYNPPEDIL